MSMINVPDGIDTGYYPKDEMLAVRKRLYREIHQCRKTAIWRNIHHKLDIQPDGDVSHEHGHHNNWCYLPSPLYWSAPVVLHSGESWLGPLVSVQSNWRLPFEIQSSECESRLTRAGKPEVLSVEKDFASSRRCMDVEGTQRLIGEQLEMSGPSSKVCCRKVQQPACKNRDLLESGPSVLPQMRPDSAISEVIFQDTADCDVDEDSDCCLDRNAAHRDPLPSDDPAHNGELLQSISELLSETGQSFFEYVYKCDFCDYANDEIAQMWKHMDKSHHHSASQFLGLRDVPTDQVVPRYLSASSELRHFSKIFKQTVISCPQCYTVFTNLHDCLQHTVRRHRGLRSYCLRDIQGRKMMRLDGKVGQCFDCNGSMLLTRLTKHAESCGRMVLAFGELSAGEVAVFPCLFCKVIMYNYLHYVEHVFKSHQDRLTSSRQTSGACFYFSACSSAIGVPERNPGIPERLIKPMSEENAASLRIRVCAKRAQGPPPNGIIRKMRAFTEARNLMVSGRDVKRALLDQRRCKRTRRLMNRMNRSHTTVPSGKLPVNAGNQTKLARKSKKKKSHASHRHRVWNKMRRRMHAEQGSGVRQTSQPCDIRTARIHAAANHGCVF